MRGKGVSRRGKSSRRGGSKRRREGGRVKKGVEKAEDVGRTSEVGVGARCCGVERGREQQSAYWEKGEESLCGIIKKE